MRGLNIRVHKKWCLRKQSNRRKFRDRKTNIGIQLCDDHFFTTVGVFTDDNKATVRYDKRKLRQKK